jgi:hypothetical protein
MDSPKTIRTLTGRSSTVIKYQNLGLSASLLAPGRKPVSSHR